MRFASRSRRRRRTSYAIPFALAVVALVITTVTIWTRGSLAAVGPTGGSTQAILAQLTQSPPSTALVNEATLTAPVPVAGGIATLTAPAPVETGTSAPQPTPTPLGGGHSQIAFVSRKTQSYQIWLMDAAGKNQMQLTYIEGGACQPAWSPDGNRLAFIAPCSGRRDTYPGAKIYIMNMETQEVTPLPVKPGVHGDFDPTFSPDNERMAFTSLRNGRAQIFVYDFSTQLLTELSKSFFPEKHPAWNPSGLQLAYVREAPNGQIWVMGRDGSLPAQFSPAGGINNVWPLWSRDGEMILYSQTTVDVFNPWLIALRYEDRNTARESRIPSDTNRGIGPVAEADLSPDGEWLAFESWPVGNNHDIYVMRIGGTDLAQLTTDRDFDISPAWRP